MSLRIIYVAKHGSGGNDDEGAVAWALEQLGHTVIPVPEEKGYTAAGLRGDLVLFHKWRDVFSLRRIKAPKVFWYWDLVSFPDPLLSARCRDRMAWMHEVMPLVDVGFLTDGDFAAKHPDKLVWLPQGADGRIAGKGTPTPGGPKILFTGIRKGGALRESFVAEMESRYGADFRHVERGVHGRQLADLIASSQIVVAPDGPVTGSYWSNRVYVTLGFGGFLLHPYCERLYGQYESGEGVVYYRDRRWLHELIEFYLNSPADRERIASAGLARTLQEHTYKDRCKRLIEIVRQRCGL